MSAMDRTVSTSVSGHKTTSSTSRRGTAWARCDARYHPRVELDLGSRRGWGYLDVALYLAGVAGLAASLTIIYLGMRAVLNVGGYCAEGGAYVIAQHCPDGVALLLPLSIFAGLGCVALMSWKGAALGGPYAGLVLLAWPALFISLGWNFLEFAFFPPPPDTGIELGWLIPGIIFVIMGAVPLVAFLPGGKGWKANSSQSAFSFDVAQSGSHDDVQLQRAQLLSDLVERARQRTSERAVGMSAGAGAAEPEDLVSRLERLDALHRSGALTYDEFQRAKQALLAEAGGT